MLRYGRPCFRRATWAVAQYLPSVGMLELRRMLGTSSAAQSKDEEIPHLDETILAAVALERLPLIVPLPKQEITDFRNFSFEWQQQFRRHYPKEFIDMLSCNNAREEDSLELKFEPGPRITEADKSNDRRSLMRCLERRLYLIVHGFPYGSSRDKAVWHFPERVYRNEKTIRLCAESVLVPNVAKPTDVYFVGNAPCGHLCGSLPGSSSAKTKNFKRFYFRSQLIGKLQFAAWNYKDYCWVTKDELLEYFEPVQSEYLKKMLVDDMTIIY